MNTKRYRCTLSLAHGFQSDMKTMFNISIYYITAILRAAIWRFCTEIGKKNHKRSNKSSPVQQTAAGAVFCVCYLLIGGIDTQSLY